MNAELARGEGSHEISFITDGTVNPWRIDTMMVQRRQDATVPPMFPARGDPAVRYLKLKSRHEAEEKGIARDSWGQSAR